MRLRHTLRLAIALAAGFSTSATALNASAADQIQHSFQDTVSSKVIPAACRDQSCDNAACDTGGCGGQSCFSDLQIASTCDAYGCGAGCDGGCDSACGSKSDGLLGFGLIKQSERCFDDFISPMSNPVFFEDPRTLSEVRFIFLNHQLPVALGGNSVQVYAMQVRAALTERLSLIATKDGIINTQSPVLDSGFADVAAGLKYNLYRDPVAGRLLSAGMTFEIPAGSNRSLQGNGNGEFNFFATAGARVGERSHVISAMGLRVPGDENLENEIMYWSNHFDVQLGNRPVYAFTEINWFHYLSSANAFPLPVEGGDLFNLGSPGVTGNDLVTQAVGLKAKPRRNIETGIAWEFPLTARQGLLDNRLTADLIIRF